MTQTTRTTLFALGALLMCIPGLFTSRMRWASIACLALGFIILLVAMIRSNNSSPLSALWLLVVSNLSFWGCYGLWHVRLSFIDATSPTEGVNIFAGTVAIWCIFLFVFLLYEGVVLLRAIFANHQRTLALISFAIVLAQIPTTLRFAYHAVQGV